MKRRSAFFILNYFIQGAVGIIYEPLDYVLKDRLKLTPGQASGFIALMTLPLLLKPLYGMVSDFLPIGKHRRTPHLFLSALVGSLALFVLAAQKTHSYLSLLLPMSLSIFALAFADTVCGGMLVEEGRDQQQTGPYQALHIGSLYLSAIAVGFGGGWLTSHYSFNFIFGLAGLLPLNIVAASLMSREEARPLLEERRSIPVWGFIRTKPFWALAITIVLWNFYPFLGTVQFYYQSNVLRLNPQWIGSLMTVGSIAGLMGSAVYWTLSQKKDSSRWVYHGPVVMALVGLTYPFYRGPVSVTVVEGLYGFLTVFFRLALFELIARTCPKDAEATIYALFLVFFDVAMYASNALGGKLYDLLIRYFWPSPQAAYWPAAVLILVGSACTLACHWTLNPKA